MTDTKLQEILRKAKKLLAFNEENATPEEVANATRLLHRMLEKYQLSILDVKEAAIGEAVEKEEVQFQDSKAERKVLLWALLRGFNCSGWSTVRYEAGLFGEPVKNHYMVLVGLPSDTVMVKHLYLTLLPQLEKMAAAAWTLPHKRGYAEFRRSFIIGAAGTIESRLQNSAPTTEEKGLVVVKDGLVKKWMQKNAPSLSKTKVKVCQDGMIAGKTAGHNVGLHRPLNSSSDQNLLG